MDMRSGKEGGLEEWGRRPGVVGGEGVGEALGGVAEDGTSVVADDDEAPARGLTTAGAAAGQVGGKRPRGRTLRQHPESPGRQRVQGVPLRTQEHLLHLAEPLHSRLARLVVNLEAYVRRGSDHKTKPKTCMICHFRMSKTPTFSFCPWT